MTTMTKERKREVVGNLRHIESAVISRGHKIRFDRRNMIAQALADAAVKVSEIEVSRKHKVPMGIAESMAVEIARTTALKGTKQIVARLVKDAFSSRSRELVESRLN